MNYIKIIGYRLFGRHHIRANFYHAVAVVMLISAIIYYFIDNNRIGWFDVVCITCFVVDYIAEMYDPNPNNFGTWYRFFHRAYDGDNS